MATTPLRKSNMTVVYSTYQSWLPQKQEQEQSELTFMILSSSVMVSSEAEETIISLLANNSDPAIEEDIVARLSAIVERKECDLMSRQNQAFGLETVFSLVLLQKSTLHNQI